MKSENLHVLQNFSKNIFNLVGKQNQETSFNKIISFNEEQCWSERDLFFIYLTKKHPDFAIIQLQLLPLYLNRTILEIQLVKNRQFYQMKEEAFDSEYNLVFADDQYKPSFFKDKNDQILCKCFLQNHIVDDIFEKLDLQRENETQRCTRNFNQLNYFRVGFISGKFLRPKKVKIFQEYYKIPGIALKELYSNLLFNGSRFVYENKLDSLVSDSKKIDDPFLNIAFKQIKQCKDSFQFQRSFKKLNLPPQDFFQPTSSQAWYNFLALGFQDNSLKQIIHFSVLNRTMRILVRPLKEQQQVVLERYYKYFTLKLQRILKNYQDFRLLSVRQLEKTLIEGLLSQKKWKHIKKEYQNMQFDWKFGQFKTVSELKQKKKLSFDKHKGHYLKIKQQESELESQYNQLKQLKPIQSKITLEKRGRKPNGNKFAFQKNKKMLQEKSYQVQNSSQQLERNNFYKKQRSGRRSNKWSEDEQFLLFLIDKSGIQQFKNIQHIFKKELSLIQKYSQQYITDIRIKYNIKFENYKNNPQSIKSIKNTQLKEILKQAINSQQRYQKGRGRQKQFITPIKPETKNSVKTNLNDSLTTIANSQIKFKNKQILFTQQQEVLMYLLSKTYGLRGLLAQKLLKASQDDIVQYFELKKIKERGSQLQVFIKARQAYYQEYPQLLQFQSNMHIKVLMNKVLNRLAQ